MKHLARGDRVPPDSADTRSSRSSRACTASDSRSPRRRSRTTSSGPRSRKRQGTADAEEAGTPSRVGGPAADAAESAEAPAPAATEPKADGDRETERQGRIPREGQRQLLTKGRNMSKTIFLVGGGKGGVGKSLMSMTVVDFLDGAGQRTIPRRDGHLGPRRLQDLQGRGRGRAGEPRRTRGMD